jgi:DNA-directed RNA polymerase subunit E'/Rpb7
MATITIRRPKSKQVNVTSLLEPNNENKNEKRNDQGNEKPDQRKIFGVYTKSLLDTKVTLSITEIGQNIKKNLEAKIISKIAGKCINEGYIKPPSDRDTNAIKVISYSSGSILGDIVEFHVVFECMICLPVEGMLIECVCKTVTKAGIHAEVVDPDGNRPVTIFVARDHHDRDTQFSTVKEGMKVLVRVIGIRFELNDLYICAIAKLLNILDMTVQLNVKTKPRIRVTDDDVDMNGGGNSYVQDANEDNEESDEGDDE